MPAYMQYAYDIAYSELVTLDWMIEEKTNSISTPIENMYSLLQHNKEFSTQ